VSWQFDRKGIIEVKGPIDEDQLLEWVMDAGGENFEASGVNFTSPPNRRTSVGARRPRRLRRQGAERRVDAGAPELDSGRLESEAKKILRLMDAIDDHDDVQNVFSNFDISDEILGSYEGLIPGFWTD